MLPFLKNRQEGGMSGPVDSIRREPDEDSEPMDILDAIADEMMEAVHRKDKELLKEVLQAFCDHLQSMDEYQDEEENFNR